MPPSAAGALMAGTPSPARPRHSAGSQPDPERLMANKRSNGCSLARKPRTASWICRCSSLKSKSMARRALKSHDLGDDVLLNLVGAAEYRQLALIQIRGHH